MSKTPSFSFGTPATGAPSGGNLFGSANTSSPFGTNSQNTSSAPAAKGLFGNVGAATTGAPSPLFGSGSTPGQAPSLFGSNTAGATGASAFSFGAQNQSSTPAQPSPFGATPSTANKTTEAATPGQTSTIGGATTTTPLGLFGGAKATPAPSGGGGLFNTTSTTPAGPPPQATTTAGQGQSLFGQAAQKPAGNLFGGMTTSAPSTTTATPSLTAVTSTTTLGGTSQPQSSGGLFTSNTPKQPMFGSTPSAAPAGGLFGNLNTSKPAESTTPSGTAGGAPSLFGAPATAATQGAPSLFKLPSAGTDSTPKSAFTPTTTATAGQPSATPATSTATPQKSLFPSLGGTTTSATPSSTPAAAPLGGGGLFSGLGAAKPATTSAAPGTPTTTTPATQPPAAAGGGLFGAKPAEKPAAAAQPPTTAATAATPTAATPAAAAATGATGAASAATGGAALGASTAGPTPPAQSRLKNKTMDEIITRWATDLTKYQKDFRQQAEKVAEWDRMLIENGTKVQKIFSSTVDAERATQEVERQLASVEGQQDELASWLDRYEREIDEMMSKQVGLGDALQGPDQERERTYKTAERLSERLDEMGKDLTSMIEEVNSASSTLSKTNKADEPISQIVRILNSHLSQLQLIDQGTAELQAKVSAAQKSSQNLSSRLGHGFSGAGAGGSAADDFYRSYMGRR